MTSAPSRRATWTRARCRPLRPRARARWSLSPAVASSVSHSGFHTSRDMRARPAGGVVVAIASLHAGWPARFCAHCAPAPSAAPGSPTRNFHASARPRCAASCSGESLSTGSTAVTRSTTGSSAWRSVTSPANAARRASAAARLAASRVGLRRTRQRGTVFIFLPTKTSTEAPSSRWTRTSRFQYTLSKVPVSFATFTSSPSASERRVVKLGDCFRARGLVGEFPRRQQHVAPPRTVELGRVAEQRLDTELLRRQVLLEREAYERERAAARRGGGSSPERPSHRTAVTLRTSPSSATRTSSRLISVAFALCTCAASRCSSAQVDAAEHVSREPGARAAAARLGDAAD